MKYSKHIITSITLVSALVLTGCYETAGPTPPELRSHERDAIRPEDQAFSTAPGGSIRGGAVIGESIESGPGTMSNAP